MSTTDEDEQELPLISIGMPICNEAGFLEQSLQALLGQTYPRLELLVSDNASDDGSLEICRRYAEQFEHIRLFHFDENQGAIANFKRVLDEAQGDYFMWASGHDLWQENYIESCFEKLRSRPEAVLAFGSTNWIDADGESYDKQTGWSDTRGLHAIARYMTIYWGNMNPILGLIRTGSLRECSIVKTVGMDLIILTQLALVGEFIHADQTSWSRREFRQEIQYADKLKRYQSQSYSLDRSWLGRLFPLARLPVALLAVVVRSRLSIFQRLLLVLLLLFSFPVKYLTDR